MHNVIQYYIILHYGPNQQNNNTIRLWKNLCTLYFDILFLWFVLSHLYFFLYCIYFLQTARIEPSSVSWPLFHISFLIIVIIIIAVFLHYNYIRNYANDKDGIVQMYTIKYHHTFQIILYYIFILIHNNNHHHIT